MLGSGLSTPYLSTLGNIENLLAAIDNQNNDYPKEIVRASLYKAYFDIAISKNCDILDGHEDSKEPLNLYKSFLKTINSILLHRKSTILSKQINLFTTNMDIFLEKASEEISLEFNDGFSGRFIQTFSLSNFKKSHFRKSLHYDNTSEIPVFNIIKMHGSVAWKVTQNNGIQFSPDLSPIKDLRQFSVNPNQIVPVERNSTIESLGASVTDNMDSAPLQSFMASYEKLSIVNPNKEKFKHTLLNHTYYELMRIYCNELEKENTVLFVMGFSFADEHFREVTLRTANSNPTLMIYIFAYTSAEKVAIETKIDLTKVKNSNIKIFSPTFTKNEKGEIEDSFQYDFNKINESIFQAILKKLGTPSQKAPAFNE